MAIKDNVKKLLNEIGEGIILEAAAKTRKAEEIDEAIEAGIRVIGENYVSELKKVYPLVKNSAEWHFIGSTKTQKHDLLKRRVLEIVDMIETVDDFDFAYELNKRCEDLGKVMPILIEVNSAKESQKSGVYPEDVVDLVKKIAKLSHVRVVGLMTMGPNVENPEKIRPYFRLTKKLFDDIKGMKIENVEMEYLSMGMSDTYRIAIEEGANIVRVGTAIFGPRRQR